MREIKFKTKRVNTSFGKLSFNPYIYKGKKFIDVSTSMNTGLVISAGRGATLKKYCCYFVDSPTRGWMVEMEPYFGKMKRTSGTKVNVPKAIQAEIQAEVLSLVKDFGFVTGQKK